MQRGTADDVKISGTGPYIVQSLTPTEIVLTKNPAYWGGRVKTDKVIVRSIPDGDTLTMALQNGEIDATQGLPYASLCLYLPAMQNLRLLPPILPEFFRPA